MPIRLKNAVCVRVLLLVVFSVSWLAMRKFVNITKISKSSEYGKKKE
jgi:hypothetical protein